MWTELNIRVTKLGLVILILTSSTARHVTTAWRY
jgi:hypothetical protein